VIRIHLSAHERERLELAFATTADRKFHDRLQIIRLAARNRPHQDIAADLGVTPRTVQRWLNAYLERGLDGLEPRKPPGPAPRLTDDLAPVLRQWVIDGPAEQGLDRANWTYPELADHLFHKRGVRVRKSAMQAFCRKHGIRPYRPTYRFLRGDPVKQATARDELAALKKGPSAANWSS
jgi:transposase